MTCIEDGSREPNVPQHRVRIADVAAEWEQAEFSVEPSTADAFSRPDAPANIISLPWCDGRRGRNQIRNDGDALCAIKTLNRYFDENDSDVALLVATNLVLDLLQGRNDVSAMVGAVREIAMYLARVGDPTEAEEAKAIIEEVACVTPDPIL